MSSRHLTTGITLAVLCGILAAGLFVGINTLFQPIGEDTPTAEPTPQCTTIPRGKKLKSSQVVVNVLNGGTRTGLAGQTLESLTGRGFIGGEVGNAPSNKVKRAQVWIVSGEETAGKLVAANLGPRTPVVKREDVIEGGVDVVVADAFDKLGKPQRALVVGKAQEVCAPDPSISPAAASQ